MEYSAVEMAQKLNISRSYLYYLNNDVLKRGDNKKHIWDDDTYEQLNQYIKKNKAKEAQTMGPKKIHINNRRFLGNKYKLLQFIRRVVENECDNVNTVADIFCGTGAVASAFTDKKIITNDILYSNYICSIAWFSSEAVDEEKLQNILYEYNSAVITEDNYMSDNFANTYFSLADCRKIGFIREDIEARYVKDEINFRERAILLTALLYAMDKIANTCGHYDAYRQGTEFDKQLELYIPDVDYTLNENNQCYNLDANDLVQTIKADLVYIDPPYNSRQYCDAYHLLENVARWEKPEVSGVARKMDRSKLKSNYCTKNATAAFAKLIQDIDARYILFSYNNMATKGNDRSNAKISDEDILRILKAKGEVKVFKEEHKAFSAGKSNIADNEERLFLCICKRDKQEMIASPLNYTGGKYKLLPQLLPHFPNDIDKAVDLLCGGCNVGINLPCSKVCFNDSNEKLVGLFKVLKSLDSKTVMQKLFSLIDQYKLSLVSENSYEYYGCESSKGLGSYNKEGYLALRQSFNEAKECDELYYLKLYLLIVYAFNNQIRFNKKGDFNLPVGKRDFNLKMQRKLLAFMERLRAGDYSFTCQHFSDINLDEYTAKSFFYIDPPYLIACATYNEQGGWNEDIEKELYSFMEKLQDRGIRFAFSNLLESKGKSNACLQAWIEKNSWLRVIDLDYNYANANYHSKDKRKEAREVLIVNY